MKHYDYIFAGTGLASLMIIYRMALSGRFGDSAILLVDPLPKNTNDRTWCFWADRQTDWDSIAFRQWNMATFASDDFSRKLDFGGYQYRLVRGIDFYKFVLAEVERHPNITFVQKSVISFQDQKEHVSVVTETGTYTCGKLFNSIYHPGIPDSQTKYPVLQQHFIGWHVKTEHPVFNPEVPTFMDFSIPQKGNTRFMYVLPFSENEAIVEYTLFSEKLLPKQEYEDAIKDYLLDKGAGKFEVIDTESGSIPMTSYPFWKNNTTNILNIGSAGGWTKASTGYTFRNSDKLSAKLVDFLQRETDLKKFHRKNRFWLYDLLLLDILYKRNALGGKIFASMFRDGDAALVFKFLDEETTVAEDLKVILKCPKAPFINALLRRVFHL